ncbi:hypothetical protein [Mesorhizobium sp. M4A.F.Ca.ET.090.04.2.1]|uniref:hypothetical protein n=1 Tax=Mesorhizobium sp. M4A.F.Ca.ET.090.04.2.1 TaxID=2496663 RepID=UPI000FCAE6B9|nr:hypothetical protein [Mesorhizobium sp. M4A.F.Ca.ET.090.04.2.1]
MKDIAEHLNASLNNVVPFAPLKPETELERLSAAHRKAIAKYDQRAADAQKLLRENLDKIEADRAAELKRHQDEIAALDARRAEELARAEKDIAADQRLSASCRAALAALDQKP